MQERGRHGCTTMPLGMRMVKEAAGWFLVVYGLDGSVERGEIPCNFCPYCGVKLEEHDGAWKADQGKT